MTKKFILSVICAIGLLFGGEWLRLADAQSVRGTYTVTDDVPLRAGPGTNHPIITTLPKGIKIQVVGKEGYWFRVESTHGDKPGYIDDRFARPDSDAQSAPDDTSTSVAGSYRTLKDVDLKEGPGVKYRAVARIPAGMTVNVVRAEGEWLRVESKTGNKPGYLEKNSVERWSEK